MRGVRRRPSFGVADAVAVGIFDRFRGLFSRSSTPSGDVERTLLLSHGPAAAADTSAAEKKIGEELAASVGGWRLPRKGSEALLTAYGELPWLHATVRRRAEALSSVEWVLFRPSKGGDPLRGLRGMRSGGPVRQRAIAMHEAEKRLEQVTDHPLLDLLENPTNGMPGPLFWELVSKWLDLVGEAPQAMEFGGLEQPVEITPILPTLIRKVPSTARPWFEVQTGAGRAIRIPEEDMLWVRQHDPADPYLGRGVGTAHVLADELETDEYMAATAKSRFYNRATPDWFIGVLPTANGTAASPESVTLLEEKIRAKHGGPSRAGNFHIINRDIRAVPMGMSLVENQYIDGRRFLRDACMQVFGVPPEILGVLTNSNRSTIDAADYLFAKFSTTPQLERLRAFYQAQLVPLFGDDLVLDYVSPIPDNLEFRKSVMVALPAAFDINEVRALGGSAPKADGNKPYPASTGSVPAPGAPKKEPPDAPANP